MPRPSRLWVFVTLILGGLTLAATAQQTRNIGNLLGKTDANHALVIAMAEAVEPYSAPRAIGNLLGKTDGNQALVVTCPDGSCGGDAYTTIADDGTPLPQRSTVNFAGAGISCADDTDQTTCTVAGTTIAPLVIEDANTVAQRNGTTAQAFHLYGTFTDASNYERLQIRYNVSDGRYEVVTENDGAGSTRGIRIGYSDDAGATGLTLSTVATLNSNFYFDVITGFGSKTWRFDSDTASLILPGTTFATLGTPPNGAIAYCSDCTVANPCASGGSGAIAKRLNGAWRCD